MGLVRNVALTAAAVIVLAAACSDDPPPVYDDAFQADFERACQVAVGGDSGADACRCWYERLSMELPFDELPALEDLTAAQAPEDVVDPELYEQLADCALAFGAVADVPVTAPPPVTLPRPATTTTTPAAEG
jgi:hypothetical protein